MWKTRADYRRILFYVWLQSDGWFENTKRYSCSLLILLGLVCQMSFLNPDGSKLVAQEPKSEEQAELVDGLLELLNEPVPPVRTPAEPTPTLTPADVGLAGEDLSDQTGNPLQGVRQSMLIAAGFLGKGLVNQQTRQLQTDIVVRLDELIEELEQASAAQQQSSQQQEQQSQQQTQSEQRTSSSNPTQPSTSQSTTQSQTASDSERQPGQADPTPDSPAQKGQAANSQVDLVDPKALQQDVWGQLPEQVRKQMQSRMVERFLPSYRQQIEAYFQALLESTPEGR